MHCKSFAVRLAPAAAHADTDALTSFLGAVEVSTVHSALVAADNPFWSVLVFYRERQPAPGVDLPSRLEPAAEQVAAEPQPVEPLTPQAQAILDQLKIWRRERARQDGVPVYVVAHNATLDHIAREAGRIRSLDDLAAAPRMSVAKAQKYGPELLELLQVAIED
jgi:superfamily II DNA helicase RecQ